jgi:hypothetical protein
MWAKKEFAIAIASDKMCTITGIAIWMEKGHAAISPDGILLGQNTLADVESILGPRLQVDSESVQSPEGNWEAIIEFDPRPDLPYKTLYRATLPPEKAAHLLHAPVFEDFRNQPVMEYSLDIYRSHNDPKK